MGLLMSDTMPRDPLLDETLRSWDGLGAWAYELDVARDPYEHEAADCIEWHRPVPRCRALNRDDAGTPALAIVARGRLAALELADRADAERPYWMTSVAC